VKASGVRSLLAAALAALGTAGCLDIGLARSVVFPPDIPGLDRGQPWVRMPVDSWVTEGGIQPLAIAGCFAASCSPAAAVGLFRAQGAEAERLARVAEDPQRLARALLQGKPRPRNLGSAPRPKVAAAAERIREGGWRGFSLHLARQDGSRGAHAAVLTRGTGGTLTIVLVVSAAEDAALRIARDVAARQD
jgi:hypothetical protein